MSIGSLSFPAVPFLSLLFPGEWIDCLVEVIVCGMVRRSTGARGIARRNLSEKMGARRAAWEARQKDLGVLYRRFERCEADAAAEAARAEERARQIQQEGAEKAQAFVREASAVLREIRALGESPALIAEMTGLSQHEVRLRLARTAATHHAREQRSDEQREER